MLSTPWSLRMGLRVPIVNAPMGGVAGGRLAAAVTAAGGLGMVGMGHAGSTSSLHGELPHVHGAFGIGLVDWVIRKEPELFDAALAAQPVLVSVSFGTDLSWVHRVHDAGIAAATQVYNSVEAQRAKTPGSICWWPAVAKVAVTGMRRSAPSRCSTPSWTSYRCRCWQPAESPLREVWQPCWPPAPAARG
jgi:hypothetical protein